MAIAFPCENCGHRFEVDASLAGKKCKCKKCGHIFLIPAPRQTVATPRPSPKPQPAAAPPQAKARPTVNPYAADEDIPYAEPVAPLPRKRQESWDDDELPPPSRVKPRKPKKAARVSEVSSAEMIPWWIFQFGGLAVLGLIPFAYFVPKIFGVLLILVTAGVGLTLYAIGAIGMLVVPFQESLVCGLLNMFVPVYPLYYLITRWDDMRRWFLTTIGGAVFFAALVVMLIVSGGLAGMANPQGARAGGQPKAGVEAELVAQLELIESQADLLATVHDVNQARAVGPQYRALRDKMQANNPTLQQHNQQAGFLERVSIDARYTARAKRAVDRLNVEVNRIQAMPELANALDGREFGAPPVVGGPPGMPRPPLPGPPVAGQPGRQPRGLARNDPRMPNLPGAPVDNPPDGDPEPAADPVRDPDPTPAPAPSAPRFGGNNTRRPKDVAASLDDVIDDLRSTDTRARKEALQRLMRTKVDPDRRVDVAAAIADALNDPDHFVRNDAAKAMGYWGGKENTAAMVDALQRNGSDHFFTESLLDAFANAKDPAAAGDVALVFPKHRERAGRALIAMGPEAEPEAIKILGHNDVFVRTEACKVLQVIGTRKALSPLLGVFNRAKGHGFDADAANQAAAYINARIRNAPKSKGSSTSPKKDASPAAPTGKDIEIK